MEIKIMKYLEENLEFQGVTFNDICEPMTLEEIEYLENLYYPGHSFPRGLREMLFLAGRYCHVLDQGFDHQEILQQEVRKIMLRRGATITRPYICVDTVGVFGNDAFVFVYADDENEDPPVYLLEFKDSRISQLGMTLSELIVFRMENMKKGYGPY